MITSNTFKLFIKDISIFWWFVVFVVFLQKIIMKYFFN